MTTPYAQVPNTALIDAVSIIATRRVLDGGITGQSRAGRSLRVADFTTLLGLSAPPLLAGWTTPPGPSFANLGGGGVLAYRGTAGSKVLGVDGVAYSGGAQGNALIFTGSDAAAYIADTGGADPFRILTGSWGCWFRTAKRGTTQYLITKQAAAGTPAGEWFEIAVASTNLLRVSGIVGGVSTQLSGVTDVAADRWHFGVGTFDGSVLRVYVDGTLEGSVALSGVLSPTTPTGPLNIGAFGADAATAAGQPFYGRIDGAFVTPDVLSEEQIRLLYAVAVPHDLGVVPTWAAGRARRLARGRALVPGDFSTTPLHLYSGGLTDTGSLAINLGGGTATPDPGPDGVAGGGAHFNGTTEFLSATDAGMPSGVAARSWGCWFATVGTGDLILLSYGNAAGTADDFLEVNVGSLNLPGLTSGVIVNDGQWHHAVAVMDNAAADGVKTKLYLDGKLIGGLTTIRSVTLLGAGGLTIGKRTNNTLPFAGSLARIFFTGYAMSAEEVRSLFHASTDLAAPSGEPDGALVEGFDAANLYVIGDSLQGGDELDLLAAA